jgi:4-hydroxybenzoate polyprenyltransferase
MLWLATTRPHLALPAWAAAATGAAWTAAVFELALPVDTVRFWAGWLAWSLALGFAHLLNLAEDRESDAINAKNCFWRGRLSAWQLRLGSIWLAVTAAGLAVWVGWPLLICVLATLLLGWLYTSPPVQLSSRAGWDLAIHLVGYGLIAPGTGAVLVHHAAIPPPVWLPAAAYLTPWIGAAFLWTTLLDHPGDAAAGKHTSAVSWGQPRVRFIARGFMVGAIVGTLLAGTSLPIGMPLAAGQAAPVQGVDSPAVARSLAVGLGVVLALLALAATTCWHSATGLGWAVILAVGGAAMPGLVRWPLLTVCGVAWLGISHLVVQRAVRAQLARIIHEGA